MATTTTSRKFGAAVLAGALTVMFGASTAHAATTTMTPSSKCEARATKKKLSGDQRQMYVDKCIHAASMKKPAKHSMTTKPMAPATGSTTTTQ